MKEGTVRTEPHYSMSFGTTLFLTGKILRLAQFGSVLRRGGLAQSFGGGGYCTELPKMITLSYNSTRDWQEVM